MFGCIHTGYQYFPLKDLSYTKKKIIHNSSDIFRGEKVQSN